MSDFLSHVFSHPVSLFEPHSSQWIMAHALISTGRLGFQDYSAQAVASFVVSLAHSIQYATDSIHLKSSQDICLKMAPLLCQGLVKWQTSLAPDLVSFWLPPVTCSA
jgi:hypothetical protein